MEEVQKMGFTNVCVECDLTLICVVLMLGPLFHGYFVIGGIFVLIAAGKSGLGLLIFFVKGMCADKLANL